MEIGKIPNDILQELILDKIEYRRNEFLIRPKVGEDCSAVDFRNNLCVISTDPITGTAKEIGRLAVHISCNDVASCGAEPIGIMITILAPPGATEAELAQIMAQVSEAAGELNVDVMGGHTEVTNAVSRFVISGVALGKVPAGKLVRTSGALPGDQVVLTKTAGIEGTAIIAYDREDELASSFGGEFVEKAKAFMNSISVVKEGIIAGEYGVSSMHDVTEGGILGAAWEVSEASGVGIRLYKEKIPVAFETAKICEVYKINPLRLISSGCMLITCQNGEDLVKKLEANHIRASVIGVMTRSPEKRIIGEDCEELITPPESDEMHKVLNSS
ncbi:MAG: AIR synthase family protein [Clostridiales bacterium]|jgi:hydrogenase maturation factor|nr:AIR synthase family protein [Eubacteriales bacterium]MDH7565132.1 AIR synthase family protein [Clostridiales bacterium]